MRSSTHWLIWLQTLVLSLLVLSACSPPAAPATPEAKPERPAATDLTVLRGARLIDGSGGPPLDDAVLVVEGQTLRAVGPARDVPVPAGAKVVELGGKTVVPGLIDNHAHIGMVEGTHAGAGHYTRANILRQLAQFEAYGVTTVTSLGFNDALFYELQAELHRGALPGADIFGADKGIGVPAAAPPVETGPTQLFRPETPEQAREAVRDTARRNATFVKIWVDDFRGSLRVKMPPEVYRAVIDEAHRNKLRVAAHVYYLEDAKQLVEAGVDVLAHGIRDQAVDDALIGAMKARNTWYIPTLALNESSYIYAEQPAWMQSAFFQHAVQPALATQFADPAWRDKVLGNAKGVASDKQALAMNQRNLKALHDAGIAIGFGTDAGANALRIPGFAEHREMKLVVQAGLTPLQAIHLATQNAALLLGLSDRGLLASGKLADFVVVEGAPATNIDDLERITAVWHRGKEVRQGVATFTP